MKIVKIHYKKIYLQIMSLKFFLQKNVFWILKQWHLNVFSFKWFEIWHVSILHVQNFEKKLKNEFSFVSFEQNTRNKIHFKVWFIKQFGVIVIYSIVGDIHLVP